MDIHAYLLTILVLLGASWREAYSLVCHVCNSAAHKEGRHCLDPFTNTTFLHDCTSFNPEAKSCRKIIQNVLGDYRVIRQCSNVEAPTECVDRIGTKYVHVTHCHCTDSYCNSSPRTSGSTSWSGVVTVALCLLYRSAAH